MLDLSLSLLGTFSAVYEERPLTQFRTKAVQALLIYLVCQAEQVHSRESLMALLWPEAPSKSAQGNLRHALYHLRQTVPDVDGASGKAISFVLADRQTVRINPDGRYHLDVAEFEALTGSEAATDWETAVALYRNDFLADFSLPDSPNFESWAQSRRADLRRRLLEALTRLADNYTQQENFEQAEKIARRQLTIDNLREKAHRQLMLVLTRNGRRPAALTHYQTLRQLLQDELQIEPSAETEALAAAIRTGTLPAKGKGQEAAGNENVLPHNLPPQATPFIGRQVELSALDRFLAEPNVRLVTITGPGGIGKTRLALAAAERQLAQRHFPHGIFFVPLTGVEDSDGVISTIAAALEIRLEQGESQLLNRLRPKQLLLLLDNFEQVMEGSSLVMRLLQAAPQLKILVTSRERLRLQGEQLYPLQGLLEAEASEKNDALELFLQAARRVQPDFAQTAVNSAALRQICRLVEGMPLALELAAAWVDLLTPAEIAAEIQRNLDFLSSGLRDSPARHSSMQAVFDASWQHLAPSEQRLLAQTTVFAGGFTREAATAIAHASLPILATLVNKSLLTFAAADGRYHIHGLLRQYAAAQLETDAALQERHCAYYCRWMASMQDKLYGPEQMTAVRKIQIEMGNLRAAISYALQQEQFADINVALPGLTEYFRVCGQRQEGIRLYQPIYNVLSSQPDLSPFTLFWITLWLSEFHGVLDQLSTAKSFQWRAQTILDTPFFQQRDTRAERSAWLHQEGYRLFQQEPAAAIQLFQESQTLSETLDDKNSSARNLIGLARAARNAGNLHLAREAIIQSLSLSQVLGNPMRQVEARLMLGNLAIAAGKYSQAEKWLQESISQLEQTNHPELLVLGLLYLAVAQEYNGRFKAALKTNKEMEQVAKKFGGASWASLNKAMNRLYLGEYERSKAMGQEALRAAQALEENRIIFEGLRLLGLLALVNGDLVEARLQLQASEKLVLKGRPLANIFSNQIGLGLAAALEGDTAVAQQFIIHVIQEAIEQQSALKLALTFTVAACLHTVQKEPEQAITLYALAQQQPFIANSRWFADVVGKRITAVAAHLSPEAIAAAKARGQTMDLWETADSLLKSQFS